MDRLTPVEERRSRPRSAGRFNYVLDVTYTLLRKNMPHTLDVKRIPEVLEQLLNDDRLTKWERNFCESLQAQLDEGKKLSERDGGQVDTLEKIYMKY